MTVSDEAERRRVHAPAVYTAVALQTITDPLEGQSDREGRVVGRFCAGVTLRVAAGLPLGALLIGPGLIQGFRDGSPQVIRENLDAFLPAMCVTLIAATLGGSIVAGANTVRDATLSDRRSAARFAVGSSLLVAIAVYVLVGWGLPLVSQRFVDPGGFSLDRAMRAHPFLLTTPELLRVQEAFRAVGGFSRRIALTLELRAWLAASVPVFALFSVVIMLAQRPRARLLKVLAVECTAFVHFFAAALLTIGPALFLRPHPGPTVFGWSALIVAAFACAWVAWRQLHPAGESDTRIFAD